MKRKQDDDGSWYFLLPNKAANDVDNSLAPHIYAKSIICILETTATPLSFALLRELEVMTTFMQKKKRKQCGAKEFEFRRTAAKKFAHLSLDYVFLSLHFTHEFNDKLK